MNLFDSKAARKLRFFEGLLSLYRATGDLRQAFRFLHEQFGSTPGGQAALETSRALERGATLTQALDSSLPGLNPLERGLLEVGEQSGSLESSLAGIIQEIQRQRQFIRDLFSRLAYPVFVLHFAGAVFCFVQSMSQGWSLAWPVLYFGALYTPVIMVLVFLNRRRHNPDLDELVFRYPGLGTWLLDRLRSRFALVLGQLYSAGIPLARALDVTADSLGPVRGHLVYEVRGAASAVRQGEPLSRHIPPRLDHALLRDAIHVGERAGSLSEELARAGRFYGEQADRRLHQLIRWAAAGVYTAAVLVVVYLVFSVYGWYFSLLG